MRKSLGMDAAPRLTNKNGREMKRKYSRNKEKFEGFVSKFIGYALKLKVFKDRDNKIKKPEDTLYYGFDKEGFHYTVRRDKI